MSKQEQLIEYITQDIILYIMKEQRVVLEEALNQFYNSEMFKNYRI